jgi:hypothetical protein
MPERTTSTVSPEKIQLENDDDRNEGIVSYYDFATDRLFQRYLQGDESAGRRFVKEVRREVEDDLRKARL